MLTSASEPSLAADTSISRRVANSGPVMGLPIGETETYDSQHCQIHMDLSEGCYHISEWQTLDSRALLTFTVHLYLYIILSLYLIFRTLFQPLPPTCYNATRLVTTGRRLAIRPRNEITGGTSNSRRGHYHSSPWAPDPVWWQLWAGLSPPCTQESVRLQWPTIPELEGIPMSTSNCSQFAQVISLLEGILCREDQTCNKEWIPVVMNTQLCCSTSSAYTLDRSCSRCLLVAGRNSVWQSTDSNIPANRNSRNATIVYVNASFITYSTC